MEPDCNCDQALALKAENERLREALELILSQHPELGGGTCSCLDRAEAALKPQEGT